MEKFKILTREEENKLDREDLVNYYKCLREYYIGISFSDSGVNVHKVFNRIASKMRKYSIEWDKGIELSFKTPVIFSCNHSNVHDYYTVQEVFKKMVNVLVASDSLNYVTEFLFKISGSALIDRDDKDSCFDGLNRLVGNLANGNNVVVFPESTWNVHPSKLMLPMKLGIIKLAEKSGCPIIPTIFEYVENNNFCSKENELYDMCIVKFGTPIYVSVGDDYLAKLEELKESMSTIRWDIWLSLGSVKREELDEDIYYNHSELKCNSSLFKYPWKEEEKYIYGSNNYIYENYPINRVIPDKNKKRNLTMI